MVVQHLKEVLSSTVRFSSESTRLICGTATPLKSGQKPARLSCRRLTLLSDARARASRHKAAVTGARSYARINGTAGMARQT